MGKYIEVTDLKPHLLIPKIEIIAVYRRDVRHNKCQQSGAD
jgi:hypothetical protein